MTPLEDFDEAYYAEGAREMLARGDLGTPYFNGQPFLLKPALIYWLIAGSFCLFGNTEFAARAGSAFLGTVTVLVTYWFTARTISRRAGLVAGLSLALNYLWIDISRDASVDVPLTLSLTAALFLFAAASQASSSRKPWLYLTAYPCAGLALLAKGPVPVGVAACGLLAHLLAARRLRAVLAEAQVLPGIALMLLVAAPWYAYEAVHQPSFLRTFFVGEHFGHIRGELARTEPAWGNLLYLLVWFFPWVAFLPAALAHAFGQQARGHTLRLMAWWSLAVVVLFSIPRSKLAHYLAPAFPAMAILVGAWFDAWLRRERATPAWGSLAFGVIGAGGAVCAIAAAAAAGMPPPVRQALAQKYGAWTPGWSAATILAALAVGLCAAVLAARWRRVLVAPLLSATMLVVGTIYVGWFGPRRAEIQAHPRKELARWLAAAPGAVPVGVYYAKRNATVFYLGRPIRDLGERRAEFPGVVRFLSSPAPAVVLTHRKFVAELRQAIPGLHLWSQRGDYVVVGNVPPP